jgi:hypothetical protein
MHKGLKHGNPYERKITREETCKQMDSSIRRMR